MADPINNKEFRHFLNFVNSIGRIEISEPLKFDASEFVIEQDGYARDVTFMNEEIDLEFEKGLFERTNTPQTLPNGTVVDKLTMGFDWLLESYKDGGFESNIEYILQRNDVDFVLGNLNYEKATTDELTFISLKVVQNTERAKIKRREGTKIDVFATENIKGETITPLSTENILLKAKPVVQISEWMAISGYFFTLTTSVGTVADAYLYQNPFVSITKSGIENTLAGKIERIMQPTSDFDSEFYDFGYIDAINDLSKIYVTLKDINISYLINQGDDIEDNWNNDRIRLVFRVYETGDYNNGYYFTSHDIFFPLSGLGDEFTHEFIGSQDAPSNNFGITGTVDKYNIVLPNIEIPLNNIPRGYRLSMAFNVGRLSTFTSFVSGSYSINTTSTAIDSVIKGVRYIDLIKQSVKSINGMSVTAPKFDIGGEFYDQIASNGNLIRQFDDEPFYVTYKDRKENLMEVHANIQVNNDHIFVGQYDDFYANVDNGGFLSLPSSKFKTWLNERYAINGIDFGYKNYEKDKDEENTRDAVHTESQWSVPNDQVQNTKSIKIGDIRDPFLIESQRKLALKETTSTSTDNKIFVLDIVLLSPSKRGEYSVPLRHNANDDGNLQLLNDATYNWNLLGFQVGDEFILVDTDNADTYSVDEITNNVITLIPTTITPTSLDDIVITEINYPYTNVAYTNRTNEGFDIIENVASGDNYSNLRYTIKRNLKHWESYFNTACSFTSGEIRNTFFQSNGDLRTQFNGGEIIVEGDHIPIATLEDKIVTAKIYEHEVVAEYDDVLALVQKYQDIISLGGFIRIQDNKGAIIKVYPQKLSYVWVTKVLTITGEQRFEGEFVEITSDSTNITINEVGYDLDILPEVFYRATGDYIVLYDENEINLINLTKFDKVKVNDVTFDNIEDLVQAIIDL